MKIFATLAEVEEALLDYVPNHLYGTDYKLARPRQLLEKLGNPQNNLRVIHVTGTSGKTSTAYYVRSLLESTGAKVGLTVSPHIETTCERIQIDGAPISEAQFVSYFGEFYASVESMTPKPTYFEMLTAFSYWVFEREKVDYAVIEVGLGGRYDATNLVMRQDKVCVINSIGYDHTEILGDTLTQIAKEKAGIITPNNVVFTIPQEPEAAEVIKTEVTEKHATLHIEVPVIDANSDVPPFLQHNFQLAFSVTRYVVERDNLVLPPDAQGLIETVHVPGRYETYKVAGMTVIFDGAHNPQKLDAVLNTMRQKAVRPAVVVAAFSEAPEQKIQECVALVEAFTKDVIFTEFEVQRDVIRHSVSLDDIQRLSDRAAGRSYVASAAAALEQALEKGSPYVVVTGSLYLVALLRPTVKQKATQT